MFSDFRLSEKMQGFHVENGIDGATLPPIQELLVVIKGAVAHGEYFF